MRLSHGPQRLEITPFAIDYLLLLAEAALERGVVGQDDGAIPGEVDVGFEGLRARLHGACKCRHAILRVAGFEAAVRDALRHGATMLVALRESEVGLRARHPSAEWRRWGFLRCVDVTQTWWAWRRDDTCRYARSRCCSWRCMHAQGETTKDD